MSIETTSDFISTLCDYYDTSKVSDEVIEQVRAWANKKQLNEVELNLFYEVIIENYNKDSFPRVAKVAGIWKKHGRRYNEGTGNVECNNVRDQYGNTGYLTVIKEIESIRARQDANKPLRNRDIDLLHEYDNLYNIYSELKTIDNDIMPREKKDIYMRKVKESIDRGCPISYASVYKELSRRRALSSHDGQPETTENSEPTLEMTVDQLVNVFGEKSKALNPEPDVYRGV